MFKKALLFSFVALGVFSCKPAKEEAKKAKDFPKPNILFIMSDDHAYQAISAYSNKLTTTPNIDRIANEGMLFTNAGVTNSICAPSRAVILTGKHSHLNGKVDNIHHFDDSQTTFPQLMQKAGYQTAMFGKLHFGNSPKGFDEFKILPGQGVYYNPDFIEKGKEEQVRHHGYATDIITDMTVNWLEKDRDPNKPFLLMYLNKAPHREWLPAERHYPKYTKMTFPEPETLFDNYEGRGTAAKTAEMNILKHQNWTGDSKLYPWTIDELGIEEAAYWDKYAFYKEYARLDSVQRANWDAVYGPINEDFKKRYPTMTEKEKMQWRFQRYMQDYIGTIQAVDEGVGRVLDYLDNNNLKENTIVVYTSDQGFYLGEHGWFDKRFAYNESQRTPLLIRWPNVIKPGITNSQMVQNLDFAQTFLEAAQIPVPSDMQGESLIPIFENGTDSNFRKEAYYHYYEYPAIHMVKRHEAITTEKYKLIHFYYDVDEWELYDRDKDPNEMNSVYDNPEYATVVAELKEKLQALRAKYKVTKESDEAYIQKLVKHEEESVEKRKVWKQKAIEDNKKKEAKYRKH